MKAGQDRWTLAFDNKIVSDQLTALGCHPKKSLTLKFPTCVPEHLLKHFIRGYFDGDGYICISTAQKKYIAYSSGCLSTTDFCNDLKLLLIGIGIKSGIYTRSQSKNGNGITAALTVGGRRNCKTFLDWIYTDSTVHLDRKYKKYLDVCDLVNNKITKIRIPDA